MILVRAGRCATVVLLALAACSTVQPTGIPGAAGVVIEAPTFKVGDEWRFAGGAYPGVVRVTALDGGQVVTEFTGYTACNGCLYFRDANLTATRVLKPDGQPHPDAILGAQYLSFPLRVGKEWEQTVNLRSGDGRIYPYRNRFRVDAFEEVSVKAGKFKAFRISQRQQNLQTQWTGIATSWWSPDVRWWIKFEPLRGTGLSAGGSAREVELASYTLK
jgi:hypothetical protein